MMLDTNAFIWFARGEAKLAAHMHQVIADPNVPVSVGLISFWEICIKHRKGKLPMPAPFAEAPYDTFEHWCARAVIDIVPIAPKHIERAMRLTFAHDDPFDRLIAATALTEDQELVTSDARFTQCPGLRVLKV
jgi:PIN domain nuclease of toxin-antitoxin system